MDQKSFKQLKLNTDQNLAKCFATHDPYGKLPLGLPDLIGSERKQKSSRDKYHANVVVHLPSVFVPGY